MSLRITSSVLRRAATAAAFALTASLFGGCLEKGFFDPTEMGRFHKDALVVPVLDKLNTGVEEPMDEFANATEPTPADQLPDRSDYTIGRNDVLNITVSDLAGPGLETRLQPRVTESGKISLPLIGTLEVLGLTEAQVEEAVVRAYRDAQLIQNAQVTATTVESRNRLFSISGAVNAPGQYTILQSDFRVLDALVYSRDVTAPTGIDYIYVIRKKESEPGAQQRPTTEGGNPMAPGASPTMAPPSTAPARDPLAPPGGMKSMRVASSGGHTVRGVSLRDDPLAPGAASPSPSGPEQPQPTPMPNAGGAQPAPGTTGATDAPVANEANTSQPSAAEGKVIIIDGKEVTVGGQGEPAPMSTPMTAPTTSTGAAPADVTMPAGVAGATDATSQPFAFNELHDPSDTRVIRIPLTALKNGELRYNIIVRPQDLILVPQPIQGVYYMGGHVQRVGTYSLGQGNRVTLKQAVIAAGMFDQLAVPWRTEVTRKLDNNRQVIAMVNVDKIFNGEEPDIYLKKDDQVIVGTQFWAPFLAAARNGFRITYGFGFLYDRNYGDRNNNNN